MLHLGETKHRKLIKSSLPLCNQVTTKSNKYADKRSAEQGCRGTATLRLIPQKKQRPSLTLDRWRNDPLIWRLRSPSPAKSFAFHYLVLRYGWQNLSRNPERCPRQPCSTPHPAFPLHRGLRS